jgi:hypothetical protein
MKNLKWVLPVLAGIVLFNGMPQLHGQSPTLAQPGLMETFHEGHFPAVLEDGFRYHDKGYLLAFGSNHTLETSPGSAGLLVYDRYGNIARQPIIWIKDAKVVTVHDVSINSSGRLIVAGTALDSNGTLATFIGEVGSDDHLRRIIRTTPFAPAHVCVLGDGTVWAYGMDRDEHLNAIQNSLRLRHYDFDKGQVQSLLNAATLPDYSSTSEGWIFYSGMPNEVDLRCNSKTAVLFNMKSGDLVEVDLKSNAMKITKVSLPPDSSPNFLITGFALTQSGEVFASFLDRREIHSTLSGLFRLNRESATTAKWVAVPGTVGLYLEDSALQSLLGADGDNLVFARQRDGRLYWAKVAAK